MKKIVVFGASGKTGSEVIKAAIQKGFCVRAVVRLENSSIEEQKNIDVYHADLMNKNSITKAATGADAVVIVFGPMPPYKDIFCAEATKNIIAAMKTSGVRRLICQTGAMVGDYGRNRSFFFEMMRLMYKMQMPQQAHDREEQERIVRESGLDWTIVKPPRLTDACASEFIAGESVKVGMMSSVSRRAIGQFIAREIAAPAYLHKAVFIRQ